MSSPDGNFAEYPGIIKTMHTGFVARTRIALCQRLGADTEETDAIYGKISSVLNACNSNDYQR